MSDRHHVGCFGLVRIVFDVIVNLIRPFRHFRDEFVVRGVDVARSSVFLV